LGHAQELIGILARAPGGHMRGAATQAMGCSSSRSGNEVDARPPPRPCGLRFPGPLAMWLAPYMQPGMAGPPDPVLVARAWPAAWNLQQNAK